MIDIYSTTLGSEMENQTAGGFGRKKRQVLDQPRPIRIDIYKEEYNASEVQRQQSFKRIPGGVTCLESVLFSQISWSLGMARFRVLGCMKIQKKTIKDFD